MKIHTSDSDAKFMIFHGTHGISYMSEDCGGNIQAFEHPEEFTEFQLNPIEKNYILASASVQCSDSSPEFCRVLKDLYYSEQKGLHWQKIQTSVVEFGW